MDEKILLNFESWKIKTTNRSKNRMKVQIKFNKEEAQAIKNFMEMVKPPELSEDDFMKGIFKIGVETMEVKLLEAVKSHAEENDLDLSAMGLVEAEDSKSSIIPSDESSVVEDEA